MLSLCGCQGGVPDHDAPDAGSGVDGKAPIPYTAEQIRAAHPDGTLLRFRVSQQGREIVQCMRFENGDADSVDVVSWMEMPGGERVGEGSAQRATWRELREHGAFDAASTSRQRGRCEVPAGRFDCWLYSVEGDGEGGAEQLFYFADEKPGPPVLLVMTLDDAEVMRMELLEYRRGG